MIQEAGDSATGNRVSLASECHGLRAQLKEWEKAFADANLGRKPGKEDIKNAPSVAAKYKTYNRKRDVLDGKKDISVLNLPSPSVRRHKSTSSWFSLRDASPRPTETLFATPRKVRHPLLETHPGILDPYDTLPTSQSPHHFVFKNAIGPTPQRGGKILGLFDCLFNSGNDPSSSCRKRKAESFEEKHDGVEIMQTPSRKMAKAETDSFDHSASKVGGRRHSRTPVSDGKKFMLSHFFATPSTARFADGVENEGTPAGRHGLHQTPLRDKVLGQRIGDQAEQETSFETTPAFLKRSISFKQRLLGAGSSTKPPANSNTNGALSSPMAARKDPSLRPLKGKPLSEILRGLRHMNDDEDEDGMDALREMETNEVNVLIGDSQAEAKPPGVGEQPARTWKKKGQKRSTRRVIMKPAALQRKRERRVSHEHEDDKDNEIETVDVEGSHAQWPETEVVGGLQGGPDPDDEAEEDLLPLTARGENQKSENCHNTAQNTKPMKPSASSTFLDSETDELALADSCAKHHEEVNSNKIHKDPKPKEKKKKTAWERGKAAKTQKGKEVIEKKGKKKGINPNAPSNMNFRSLKIRNRNASTKGSGGQHRFGRGRR